jgi:hypothetical protein
LTEMATAAHQAARIEASQQSKRVRLKAWGLWGAALVLTSLGFALGRLTADIHHLPALAATLPGDESAFNRELDERVRKLFPPGTSDDKLIAYLSAQGFTPEWREGDHANAASFTWSGVLCTKVVRIIWRADAAGALSQVNGSYQSQCVF